MGVPSYISSATGTNTVTLPAHQVGDIILGCAFRDGSNTAPTIPSGQNWSAAIKNGGANTCSMVLVAKRATSTSEGFGTFTNATSCIGVVVRGARAVGFIGGSAEDGASSNNPNFPTVSMSVADGSSLVLGFIGHRSTNTTITNAPTGMTNRNSVSDATDQMAVHDTNGGVSSWSGTTVSIGGTASGYRSITVEILAPWQSNLPSNAKLSIVGSSGINNRVSQSTALPSGAVVGVVGAAPHSLVSESTALPSGALLEIEAGGAPTIDVTEDVTPVNDDCLLPGDALVSVIGAAPVARVSESTQLLAGEIDILGAAPTSLLSESTALPAGVVNVQGNAPTSLVSESTALPTGAVVSVEGNAPTFTVEGQAAFIDILSLTQGGFAAVPPLFVCTLPDGASVSVHGNTPSFRVDPPAGFIDLMSMLQGGIAVPVEPEPPMTPVEPAPGGAFSPGYDAILWPPQWAKPLITLCLLPSAVVEIRGNQPSFRLTENVRSALPAAVMAVTGRSPTVEISRHVRCSFPVTAKISTRGNAPAILITSDGISDAEVLCLMLL